MRDIKSAGTYPCTTNPAIAMSWITYRTVVKMLVILLVCVQVEGMKFNR